MADRRIKIKKEDAIVVGIDFQDRLMPAMMNRAQVEEATVKLIKGCRILDVPIIITQQYTKGLGPTVPSILDALINPIGEEVPACQFEHIEKTSFSAMDEPTFVDALEKSGKSSDYSRCGIPCLRYANSARSS